MSRVVSSRLRCSTMFASLAAAFVLAGTSLADDPSRPGAAAAPSEVRQLIKAGKYQEADVLARRRLAETEAESGRESLPTALALDDLAEVFWRLGKGADQEGRDVAARAARIKEALLGGNDPRLAVSLRHLAILTNQNGDYAQARQILERTLRINEDAFGPDSAEVATSLDTIATILRHEGDYAGARPLAERALAIRRRVPGIGGEVVASAAMNLATTVALMGDYDGARPLMEESVAILGKIYPPDHPVSLLHQANLAELMMLAGDYESARPIQERILKLREEKLGPDHFHVALSLESLGHLELATGHMEAALGYLTRTIQVREKAFGPEHPMVAQGFLHRGEARLEAGDLEGARADYERALRIQTQTLDARHPDRAQTLAGLAKALVAIGDGPAAFDRGLEAARLSREHFQSAAQGLPEADALRYAEGRDVGLDVALSVLAMDRKGVTQGTSRAWDQVVRSRAMVLDEMASRHRYVSQQADEKTARSAQALIAARGRLARLLGKVPQSGSLDDYRKQIDGAYAEKEAAERALAEASAAFRRQRARSQAGLEQVLRSLPREAAFLAYVRFEQVQRGGAKTPAPAYGAFVFRAGLSAPLWVPLGRADEIDGLVETWQREIGTDPRSAGNAAGALSRYRTAGDRLRRKIWDPVAPLLGRASMVLIVPDGSLNLVSLATLPAGGDRFLLEQGPVLHYLSSERDLVPTSPVAPTKPGLLAIGAVDYDSTPTTIASGFPSGEATVGPEAADPDESRPRYRSPESVCASLNTLRFSALPATSAEIESIADLVTKDAAAGTAVVRKLSGAAADEATFKDEAGRFGILHLATHAFIASGSCDPQPKPKGVARGNRETRAPALRALQDPLLLSGLALAGANRHAGPERTEYGEDGLLTAEEIAFLDLSGVRWAVLSACRTGVGVVRDGEGVLGLRRAFNIAGAGTLIMSLWQVEDQATSAWMKALYQARARPSSSAESVRQASLALLLAQRNAGRSSHPFFWGAFIAAGDWN